MDHGSNEGQLSPSGSGGTSRRGSINGDGGTFLATSPGARLMVGNATDATIAKLLSFRTTDALNT